MKKPFYRSMNWILGFTAVALIVTLVWIGCGEKYQTPSGPEQLQENLLSADNPQVKAVMEIQNRHTNDLMAKAGVVGVGTGMTEDGRPAIVIFTTAETLAKGERLPLAIEEVPVVVEVTGEFKALRGGGSSFDTTIKHRPAPNGVSLGHPDITAGTLGCLVTKNNTIYILSNNHVMADENQASIGDNILQPGTFDGGQDPADRIATLSEFETIIFSTSASNVIDAAIADVDNDADVTGATEPAGYGSPRSNPITAAVGMRVKKYGRTTKQTTGRVSAINATVNVGYSTGVARFVNQIVIGGGSFSAGGDSGSLIVVNGGSNDRRPVGLLFAGSSTSTIANPIGAVLSEFGVTVVGD